MESRIKDLEKSVDSLTRLFACQAIALGAVLSAISKQPGIDTRLLTEDISHALLQHQIGQEKKPEGVSMATDQDYQMIRFQLRASLPDLPIV